MSAPSLSVSLSLCLSLSIWLTLFPPFAVSCSYDLLFGITESESYHTLAALALEEGLRENERDNLLRFYMQSRFDVRPDLALAATLKK